MTDSWDENTTIGDLYHPAMSIEDAKEAEEYLKRLVDFSVKYHGKDATEALNMHKQNLGYFAGYYDAATAARVNKLFNTYHPIFGKKLAEGDK